MRAEWSGFFGWLAFTKRLKDVKLLEKCGVDAYVIAQTLNLAVRFFTVTTLIACIVIIPVHVIAGRDLNPDDLKKFSNRLYTIEYVAEGSKLLFVHVVVAWTLFISFYYFLRRAYLDIIEVKNEYALKVHARTILIEGMSSFNPSLPPDQELARFFDGLDIGGIERVTIVRRCFALDYAIKQRWRWLVATEKLAVAYEKTVNRRRHSRNPFRSKQESSTSRNIQNTISDSTVPLHASTSSTPFMLLESSSSQVNFHSVINLCPQTSTTREKTRGSSSLALPLMTTNEEIVAHDPKWLEWFRMSTKDKLIYSYHKYLQADRRVLQLRERYAELSTPSHAAFITFQHPVTQAIASQVLLHSPLTELKIKQAPDAFSLYYSHIFTIPVEARVRYVIINVILALLIPFWIVPMGFIAGILNYEKLVEIMPWLESAIKWNTTLQSTIKGVLAPLAVMIFNALLPMILYFLSQLRRFKTYNETYIFTFRNCFWFLLFNVIIFLSFVPEFAKIEKIIKDIKELPNLLAAVIPSNSPFFINYTMLAVSSLTLSLISPGRLIFYYFFKITGRLVTPRDWAWIESPDRWNTTEFAFVILIAIIGFVYATIAPLITPITLTYFIVASVTYRYRLYHCYVLDDGHGHFWTNIVVMFHSGVLLSLLILFGVLSLKKSWGSMFILPLFIAWALLWIWIKKMERRMLHVPLDVWKNWRRENEGIRGNINNDNRCQGKIGVEMRMDANISPYDDILLTGDLPQLALSNSELFQLENAISSCASLTVHIDEQGTSTNKTSNVQTSTSNKTGDTTTHLKQERQSTNTSISGNNKQG